MCTWRKQIEQLSLLVFGRSSNQECRDAYEKPTIEHNPGKYVYCRKRILIQVKKTKHKYINLPFYCIFYFVH